MPLSPSLSPLLLLPLLLLPLSLLPLRETAGDAQSVMGGGRRVMVVVAVYVVQNTGSGAQCPRARRCRHFCWCCVCFCRHSLCFCMGGGDARWEMGGRRRAAGGGGGSCL